MKSNLIIAGLLAMAMMACNSQQPDQHDHGAEDIKLQLISYSDDFEVFAEADPFVVDQPSSILAHFTFLADFKPLEQGAVTVSMITGKQGIRQIISEPLRPGIYLFTLTPLSPGTARLVFDIDNAGTTSRIEVPDITIYSDAHEAAGVAGKLGISDPNAIIFTKEQSWKVDFATDMVTKGEFAGVIRTNALVQAAQTDKMNIIARASGIVELPGNVFEGMAVEKGQDLLSISGTSLATNNSYVTYVEARNRFEESKANYDRLQLLAQDRIVTQAQLLAASREYETASARFKSLEQDFEGGRHLVRCPADGFIGQLYVANGQFVEAGEILADLAQNHRLVLMADVPQRYADQLPEIKTANIRNLASGQVLGLDDLNGELASYGKSTNASNYLIPVRFEIDNNGTFMPGSFVELYILTGSAGEAISVPKSALLEEQGKFFVMVQLTPELFARREVETGRTDGVMVHISEGLKGNERVVTQGALMVKISQASGALDPHAGHVH